MFTRLLMLPEDYCQCRDPVNNDRGYCLVCGYPIDYAHGA